MYIEFKLPHGGGGSAAGHCLQLIRKRLIEWSEQHEIRYVDKVHKHTLRVTFDNDKLYHFLSGWTGGPDLYTPRYGNAFLRARHLPFAIGTSARDQWLTCMVLAMQECEISEDKQDVLLEAFFRTADWMRNKPDN
jgi:truncated hemoglobin YjbI